MSEIGELRNPGRRIPEIALPRMGPGSVLTLRGGTRHAAVLVLIHQPGCVECHAFLATLAAREKELEEWNARVIPIVDGRADAASDADPLLFPFPTLLDSRREVAAALDLPAPALIIADRWGEIAFEKPGGPRHDFPPVDEVIDWTRFVDLQCPECQGEAF